MYSSLYGCFRYPSMLLYCLCFSHRGSPLPTNFFKNVYLPKAQWNTKKFTKLKNWWILKSYYMKSSTHGSEKNILMSGRYIWSIWSRLHFRYHTLRNSRVVGVVNATFFFVESKNSYPFVFRRLRGSSEIADC